MGPALRGAGAPWGRRSVGRHTPTGAPHPQRRIGPRQSRCSRYLIHRRPAPSGGGRRRLTGGVSFASRTISPVVRESPGRVPSRAPEVGDLVQVRQRHWIVEEVAPGSEPGHAAVVSLACADDDAQGEELRVFWECEPDRRILTAEAWTSLGERGFDPPRRFAAYLNTLRWNAVTATDPNLLQAPFRAGITLDAYQMEPLRKALAMPRVALFIADDTGLGKTIEAGLIARELLLRKKVRSIVVAAPASVLEQWRAEMDERFGLRFEILDRRYFARMRHERGYAVNPWRTHSRFLVSHNLLTSETYAHPLREWLGDRLPASLLILDEAHHAAPAGGGSYGIESKFTRAVRDLAARFEHRLFLSATPHNGHSNSFSTLMELLDPYRFTRGVKVTDRRVRDALTQVMVRRLKEDIRAIQGGFPRRIVKRVVVDGLPDDAPELVLSRLLDEYRSLRERRFHAAPRRQQSAAALLTVGLQQRLLSSVEAFARSLAVHRRTVRRQWEQQSPGPRTAAKREPGATFLRPPGADEEDEGDGGAASGEADLDAARSCAEAAEASAEDRAIAELDAAAEADRRRDAAVRRLWEREQALLERMARVAEPARGLPDAKTRHLLDWIRRKLCPGMPRWGEPARGAPARWNDRRVIVFTENREGTKAYLRRMLEAAIESTDRAGERIAVIDGLVAGPRRREVQRWFNTPPAEHPLRILLATDAAREGLNFQAHCSDLFHFDLPWNPGRIEQRNGRIDRKLQPRDEVTCRYFKLPQRTEDRVLEVLVRKTETIRHELGSLSRVIGDDIERRLRRSGIRHADADRLAHRIGAGESASDAAKRRLAEEELASARSRQDELDHANERCGELLNRSRRQTGFDAEAFREALSCSLEILGADPLRETRDPEGKRLWTFPRLTGQPGWEAALDALRAPRKREQKLAEWRETAPIRPVIFEDAGRLTDDRVQLHLEQRVARRLLSRFRAQGFVYHDLSRACLVQARDSIPRVVLLGRLCLFGSRGERLHEELTCVSARWTRPGARRRRLAPYRKSEAAETERLLTASLGAPGHEPPPRIRERLQSGAARDIAELLPHLEADATRRSREARRQLARRGTKEAADLKRALERQRERVAQSLRKHEETEFRQLKLFGDAAERRQQEEDVRAWRRRLDQFAHELATEPASVRRFYEVKAERFEPVGLAYLWPDTN